MLNKFRDKKSTIIVISCSVVVAILLVVLVLATVFITENDRLPESPKDFFDNLLTPAEIESGYIATDSTESNELPETISEEWFINHWVSGASLKGYDKEVVTIRNDIPYDPETELYKYNEVAYNKTYLQVVNYIKDFSDKLKLDFDTLVVEQQSTSESYISLCRFNVSDRSFIMYTAQLDTNKDTEITIWILEVTNGT